MKKSQVILTQYSPLLVVDTEVVDSEGVTLPTPRVCSLCRCGASANKPFCDGSHTRIGFTGQRDTHDKPEPERYEGKHITIVFDRQRCMGDGHCGELEAVFGTHDAPIYEPDAAPVEAIIATIKQCPSGALSYELDGQHHTDWFEDSRIVVEKDGPLHCQGSIDLIDDQASDKLLATSDHYTLCRCGASKQKPFCDGSHHDIGFKD